MTQIKPFHHGDLKRVLFDAALALLDEHGAGGVTIRAVAKAAGVSHGAPVNHYKDRRALLTALAKAQFDTLLTEIVTRLADLNDESGSGIEIFASAMMDFGFRYPNRYRLLWRADLIDHAEPELLEIMDGIYDRLCAEFSKAVPTRKFDKDTYAVALWSMVHGYVDMRLSGMFEPLNDSISGAPRGEAIIDMFRKLLA
jgi:AcrR family transcriptional regulator